MARYSAAHLDPFNGKLMIYSSTGGTLSFCVLNWVNNKLISPDCLHSRKGSRLWISFKIAFKKSQWLILLPSAGLFNWPRKTLCRRSFNKVGNSLVANRSVFQLFLSEKSNHFPLFWTELNPTILKIFQIVYWIKSNHILYKMKMMSQSVIEGLTHWTAVVARVAIRN